MNWNHVGKQGKRLGSECAMEWEEFVECITNPGWDSEKGLLDRQWFGERMVNRKMLCLWIIKRSCPWLIRISGVLDWFGRTWPQKSYRWSW